MRSTAAVFYLSLVYGIRQVYAFRAEAEDEEQLTVDWDHRHLGSSASSVEAPEIPGYSVRRGEKCRGTWIEFWENGDLTMYGISDAGHQYTEPLECARVCNQHEVCSGFTFRHGVCSCWRSGSLVETRPKHAHGQACYIKLQAGNLDDVVVVPADDELKRPQGPQVADCLCVFNVDRTLTARQGRTDCPGTEEQTGIHDRDHVGGTLVLSELALGIKESRECGQCYFGMVSSGSASGPNSPMRSVLDGLVEPQFDVGGYVDGCPSPVSGTKIMACGRDGIPRAVRDIVEWLGDNGVIFERDRVHYFDDKALDDHHPDFHAHQVSCASRGGHGIRGLCGGTMAELDNPAQHLC